MEEKLKKLKEEILANLNQVGSLADWRELEIKYLGRKGAFTEVLRSIATLPIEARKTIGASANELKKELARAFRDKQQALESLNKADFTDVTLPGDKIERGHLHPLTIVQNELADLFRSLGFLVLDGPELESDFYNFTALNIPRYHPARDMQDTFYIDIKNKAGEYDMVMRTHTSPMQIRGMRKYGAPVKFIVPGRCYRSEATDARHEHTFYQLEGVMVDIGISLSHLKGFLEAVAKSLYGPDTKIRFRPKHYPFVEPGMNGEVTCQLCNGGGCRVCKFTGWLEIFGSGMIHPNVLKTSGIDPAVYSGFAFGFGLDRLVMLKYDIDDTRLFNSGDLRFLEQF